MTAQELLDKLRADPRAHVVPRLGNGWLLEWETGSATGHHNLTRHLMPCTRAAKTLIKGGLLRPDGSFPERIKQVEGMPEPIPVEWLSTMRMGAGDGKFPDGRKKCDLVINGGLVKRYVGIGWTEMRNATPEDYKTIPQVRYS